MDKAILRDQVRRTSQKDCDYCWAHHLGGMVEGENVVAHRCPACGCDIPESEAARKKRAGGEA